MPNIWSVSAFGRVLSDDELKLRLAGIRAGIRRRVDEMPAHVEFLRQCLNGAPAT